MDKKKEERLVRAVKELSKLPPNRRCADCTEKLPQYVNLTFATFICTACSGIHREFSHRVKSISLSTFSLEEVKALKEGGNEACTRLYLAKWDPRDHPEPEAGQEQRVRDWIRAKYIEKRWHVDSNYVPRVRAGSRDADFGRRGSYDPHPTSVHTGGSLSRSRTGSGGGGAGAGGGGSSRSLGGSVGVPQSQPISAVLPDVKQVQVQRPHQHPAQAPKRQSINLLDLAFGPSSPERPPAPAHAQAASGGFDADPFASQPSGGLGASASAASQGAPAWPSAVPGPVVGFPPSAQADPFATPHFPAPPAPLVAAAPRPLYPPIPPAQHIMPLPPPQQPPQHAQAPYTGGWAQPPPQQPHAPVAYSAYGAPPAPAPAPVVQLPPGAVRPLPSGPPRPAPTLSIEDAFSGLGLDASAAGSGGLSGSVGAGGAGAGPGPVQQVGGALPTFAPGEEVIYTDSQGNRSRTTVVKVHTDDHPPYYTIRLAGGTERQTDFHHIAKLAPPPQAQQPPPPGPPPAGPTGSGVGVGGSASPQPWGGEVGKAPAPQQQHQQQFAGAGPYGFPAQRPPPQQQQANPFLAPAGPGAAQQPPQQQQQQPQAPVSGNPFDMF